MQFVFCSQNILDRSHRPQSQGVVDESQNPSACGAVLLYMRGTQKFMRLRAYLGQLVRLPCLLSREMETHLGGKHMGGVETGL